MQNIVKPKFIITILLLLVLTACNFQKSVEQLVDKKQDAFAKAFIAKVITGDTSCISMIDSSILNEESFIFLDNLEKYFKATPPKSIKVLGWRKHLSYGHQSTYIINYQYEFEQVFALFSVTLAQGPKSLIIKGFNADFNKESYSKKTEFSFAGKGIVHYIVLLLSVTIPIFVITTLVVLIKTTIRRKWLWILAVIFFNIGAAFSWSTGKFLLSGKFILLALSIQQSNIEEGWLFTIALPIGSILFWLKRRRIRREEQEYNELIAMYPQNNDTH